MQDVADDGDRRPGQVLAEARVGADQTAAAKVLSDEHVQSLAICLLGDRLSLSPTTPFPQIQHTTFIHTRAAHQGCTIHIKDKTQIVIF
ncbi:hypothetical protein GCM10020221_04290 [Streptomyces thioluteus]|uniref:Uncharacterized protein n=1 Tax=Streptomyces thioluteus TaxID=66431 RepID=A0ABN3WF34_STRTU